MPGRPFSAVPTIFASQGAGVPNNIPMLDADFAAVLSFYNDSAVGWVNGATDIGIANAYVATLTPAPSAYLNGMSIALVIANTNTGASTINLNAIGSAPILNQADGALSGGELQAGGMYVLIYHAGAPSGFWIGGSSLVGAQANGLELGLYNGFQFKDDFAGGVANWTALGGTGGAAPVLVSTTCDTGNKGAGVLVFNTGTTSNGASSIQLGNGGFCYLSPGLGPCEIDFRVLIATLPLSAQQYNLYMGLGDSVLSFFNSVVIGINSTASLTQWYGCCVSSGTTTSVTGGSISSGGYHKFSIQINAAWTSVSFFVDGAQIGTAITTNIPTAAVIPVTNLVKTSGTTAANAFIDKMLINYQYTM